MKRISNQNPVRIFVMEMQWIYLYAQKLLKHHSMIVHVCGMLTPSQPVRAHRAHRNIKGQISVMIEIHERQL